MNIFIPVIFFVVLLLILPVRVDVMLNIKLKEKKVEFEPIQHMNNILSVKILFFLNIFRKNIFEEKNNSQKKKRKKNKENQKLLIKALYNSLKFNRLILSLGLNTFNDILNSYINAGLNASLCMYINKNSNKFRYNNLYYQIYMSEMPLVLNLDASIYISPIKAIFEYIKQKIKLKTKSTRNVSVNV